MIDVGLEPSLAFFGQMNGPEDLVLTPEEMGQAARIINASAVSGGSGSDEDIDRCVSIIGEESVRPGGDAIASASAEDLQNFLQSLNRRKD